MRCEQCDGQMVELGRWPGGQSYLDGLDTVDVVYRYHCKRCDKYQSEIAKDYKCIRDADGTYQEVIA